MEKIYFGTLDGEDIYKITIGVGRYMFSVITLGATLCYFGTKDLNIVLSHDSLSEYIDDPSYMGEVVGPIANRISNASFMLDGKTYRLDKNDGNNTLHSGSACYGRKVWSIAGIGANSVTLVLHTASGLGGFPGEHDVAVTYSIYEDGCLNISYRSVSSKKCPVNITNHAYFNLSGSDDIRGTYLSIDADSYISVDDALIPIATVPVSGSDYDFREAKRIGDRRDGKYDNYFVLNKNGIVKAEGSKASLMCRTTERGVQLYTGEFLSNPFGGFCLETGGYNDFVNHKEFPTSFTDSGIEYISNTTYRIGVK